jgi:hypothetical protein
MRLSYVLGALYLLFAVVQAQNSNETPSSTLDPTITGIIAGVGVVVVLGLSFLLWRVRSLSVCSTVCGVSHAVVGLSQRASAHIYASSCNDT